MWKIVEVWFNDKKSMEYKNVAGVREDDYFLIIRQGSFPYERIIKNLLCEIYAYDICTIDNQDEYREWDYEVDDEDDWEDA